MTYREEMKQAMPTVFKHIPTGDNVEVSIGKGWWPLVEELAQEIERIDPNFTVGQVKEKFGLLRFYHHSPNKASSGTFEIQQLYEKRSGEICEGCGVASKPQNRNGWYTTYCDPCYANRNG